jgi:hypothetical protein
MLLLAALLAGPAIEPTAESIHYRVPEALVVDKDGRPLFRAPRDFLLKISGNPDGRILAYDAARRMIRVSEHNPWWIPCSQVQPQAVACAEPQRPKTRSIRLPQAETAGIAVGAPDSRGVPSCPGDPRCPTGN